MTAPQLVNKITKQPYSPGSKLSAGLKIIAFQYPTIEHPRGKIILEATPESLGLEFIYQEEHLNPPTAGPNPA